MRMRNRGGGGGRTVRYFVNKANRFEEINLFTEPFSILKGEKVGRLICIKGVVEQIKEIFEKTN